MLADLEKTPDFSYSERFKKKNSQYGCSLVNQFT